MILLLGGNEELRTTDVYLVARPFPPPHPISGRSGQWAVGPLCTTTSLTVFSVPRQELSEYNATAIKSPTNTVTVQGLKAGAIYVFQVRARTVAGYGRYSGKMYFQTMTEGKRCQRAGGGTDSTDRTNPRATFPLSAFVPIRNGTPLLLDVSQPPFPPGWEPLCPVRTAQLYIKALSCGR